MVSLAWSSWTTPSSLHSLVVAGMSLVTACGSSLKILGVETFLILQNLELTEAAFHLMSNEEAGSSLKILDVSYCDEITVAAESTKDKEAFGLVCKRWLGLQSTETKITARAGLHMLRGMSDRFTRLVELDYSQFASHRIYPDITDSDLASLDVTLCTRLTDMGLSVVAKGCCDLRILRMAACKFVTDGVLVALSKNCHDLEELRLELTSITDDGLISLASGCHHIKILNLYLCQRACSRLKTLKLMDCYEIGDGTILSLAKFCGNLETLNIVGSEDVSADAMKTLATACGSSLKILSMDGCPNVSDYLVSCILCQCRNLEALGVRCCEELTDVAFSL
ncbi:F-box/LRR-repeat protein 4 [Glycine soja]